MTFETDIQSDYLFFDGIETVQLTVDNGSQEKQHTVAGALRLPLTRSEVQFFGVGGIESQRTVWSLPVTNCGGLVPKNGDVIRGSDDVKWTIENVDKRTRNSRYRCVCVQQR